MARQGWTLLAGIVIGAGVVLAMGMAQPPRDDDVAARLDRLERAMLKPESTLPEDPKKSIEAMLEQVLASARRTEATLAGLDNARIEDLATRVRFIHDSLLNVKVGQVVDLERRIGDIERQFRVIGTTTRLEDIVRRVDQVERDVMTIDRTVSDNQRRADRASSDVQRLERRVSRVESKIR